MLSIICGKPGSGKTYHMSTLLVDMLTDWMRFELKNGTSFDSSIWTNIVFKLDGLNETISKRVGKDVDVSHYIHVCDDEFFHDDANVYWWKKFPPRSVIIIDEVHFYLGKKVEYGSLDLEQELINWISTHRHGQQEIYFLSQHTDQFANQVLGIADKLVEIVNVKSLELPFPISVPMADVDELKRAFGITTQYYQANIGNFRGKAVKWNGAVHRHLMSEDIFRVYKSHDAGVEESDRPQLKMSRLEGVLWFARRHAWHLVPKALCVPVLIFVVIPMLFNLPTLFADSMSGGKKDARSKVQDVKPNIVTESPAAESAMSITVPEPMPIAEPVKPSVKIVMLFERGVMLDDGTKIEIGETLTYEGQEETLACVSVECGIAGFESGKRVRF